MNCVDPAPLGHRPYVPAHHFLLHLPQQHLPSDHPGDQVVVGRALLWFGFNSWTAHVPLWQVCDYIHLNPVRAGIQPLLGLADYRHSSYWYLHRPKERPRTLLSQTALTAAGGLEDTAKGWRQYADHLARELAESVGNKRRYASFSTGWAIGSDAFKAEIISKHAPVGSTRAWTLPGAEQMREAQWQSQLQNALATVGHSLSEARAAPKSEIWKLAVATWMRDAARARNGWLSMQLFLGTPTVLSRNLTRYRCTHQRSDPNWSLLTSTFSA